MPKKYAVCVALRDDADPRGLVHVIEKRGWQATGRMHYLEPDEQNSSAAILGSKIPKKLWRQFPELMLDERSILFPIKKNGFEINMRYICDRNLRAVEVAWKSLAAPEDLYSDLFLPLASGFGACLAACIQSEGDWASDGFRNDCGALEVRPSSIGWAQDEHQLYVCKTARNMVRGVVLGGAAGDGWLHATLET